MSEVDAVTVRYRRTPEFGSVPRSAGTGEAAASDPYVAESLARKYVAANRYDKRGWRTLLSRIEANGSGPEAVRIASAFLSAFPTSPDVRSFVALVYCNHGEFERARALLDGPDQLDDLGALTQAQLRLLSDPIEAGVLFANLRTRGHWLETDLGEQNARALAFAPSDQAPLAFFLFQDWHRAIQRSVFEAAMRRSLRSFMTTTPWLVRAFRPDVVVVSDTQGIGALRHQVPGIRIVHTRHGLADKNYGFAAAGLADHVCVTSDAVAAEYVQKGLFEKERFWVTGYPQLDPMFIGLKRAPRPEPRTVLFAPTYNEGLSAGHVLGRDAIRKIRGDDRSIRVIARPHPAMRVTAPDLLNAWRAASLGPNVEFNDDPNADIGVLMARAAVMVSDISSIALLYLALDRPIVCLDVSGTATSSGFFAPDAIEGRLREAADVVSCDGLSATVAAALDDPKRKAPQRRELRRHVFSNLTDGRAGERIIDRIAEMRGAR